MIDVLIVGSGGAGLTAALNAKKKGSKVLVVSKTHPTASQTCQAQGGINAVLNTNHDDNINQYIKDTYKASHNLGNKKNIEYFCSNSKDTINWLDSIGVSFSRDKNCDIAQRKFGGTKAKRTCYSSDYTGLKILHTLYDQCIKEDIEFLDEHLLLNLIVQDNITRGIVAFNIISGEVIELLAKTVILATGGYSGIYHGFTTNSYASTGDGIATAFRAGAKISNMEFVQFHPTALENKNILISESARGEGGYLIDEDGNRFIDELKPRDEVARAIYEKNQANQKVYLDLRHLGLERINQTMPQERRLIKEFINLEMENDLIPINPSAHYSMGGILTDIEAKTSIQNLYACGECSQSGIHGANRLGGNSLLEIITFGKVAGINASKKAQEIEEFKEISNLQYEEEIKNINSMFSNKSQINFYKQKEILGKEFFRNVGLFRDEKKMQMALKLIQNYKSTLETLEVTDKSKTYNKNLCELIEFKNIVELANLVLISAIDRKESRGAHFRTDFSKEENHYSKNTILIKNKNQIDISFQEII